MNIPPADPARAADSDPPEGLSAVIKSLWDAWSRFWFTPRDPTTLGLMRICVGSILFYVHLAYSFGLVENYVGKNAWINGPCIKWMRQDTQVMVPAGGWGDAVVATANGQPLWSIYFHVQDPGWIVFIHTCILIVMFLFTLGLATRVTGVLTWLGVITYIHRTPALLFGMDTMTNLASIYLMLSPCGAALSLDRWLAVRRERQRHGPGWVPPPPEPLVSANFATRLIQINFCMIYFASGTSKLMGASWWNGTAPNMVLLNYNFAPFSVALYPQLLAFLVKHRWLWELCMTAGVIFTLVLELGFPLLVWNRQTRWLWVCGSILLHTMIGLFMNLVTFSLVMISMVLAFLPPETIYLWLQVAAKQIQPLLHGRGGAGPQSTREAVLTTR